MTNLPSAKAIWYISKYIAPPGPSTVGSRGYHLMRELARGGDHVMIVTSDSNHLAVTPDMDSPSLIQHVDGLVVHWVRTLKFIRANSLRRIFSWIHFEWRLLFVRWDHLPRPDAIIVSSLSLLTVLNGVRLKRKYDAKLVFEVRDIWPLTLIEEGGFSERNPLVKVLAAVERFGYRQADIIVGTMPNLSAHVENVLGRARSVDCIPMGYSKGELTASKELPEEYFAAGVPEGKFLVGYAGSVGITNALDPFFRCIAALSHDERIHFVIVGDGGLRQAYEDRYGHLPNVTFVGRVPKAAVQSVLEQFDLLYFSAHLSKVWVYGQSLNKLIDYMLSGRPVLASYTGFPSMINEADCGVFVPAGDVEKLTDEVVRLSMLAPEELSAIGARGSTWIRTNREYKVLAKDYRRLLFGQSGERGNGSA